MILSGDLKFVTDASEEKVSKKGTRYVSLLARSKKNASLRCYIFEDELQTLKPYPTKGSRWHVIGELLSAQDDVVAIAIKAVQEPDEAGDDPGV